MGALPSNRQLIDETNIQPFGAVHRNAGQLHLAAYTTDTHIGGTGKTEEGTLSSPPVTGTRGPSLAETLEK